MARLKGFKHSQETIQKMRQSQKGKIVSKETRKKISEALKKAGVKPKIPFNRKGIPLSASHKEALSLVMRGKHLSLSHRKSISRSLTGLIGDKARGWIDGRTPINKIIRGSTEYKLWREAVFARDGWKCVWCGQVGGVLNADHIKRFSAYPELRFAIDNGRTLCQLCHKATDNFGKKGWKKKK